MNVGVELELEGDGDSLLVRLDAIDEPIEEIFHTPPSETNP
jgi:hypothetical protein